MPGFGDDCADEECAERHAVAEFYGEQRNAKAQADDGHEQHLVTFEFRDVIEQPRHGDEPADEQRAEEGAESKHGAADVFQSQ